MPSMYDDVVKFHDEILGFEQVPRPTLHTESWLLERYRFLIEETEEFYNEACRNNMVGAVDGLLDTVYVALGTLHMMGVPTQECWDAVQTANMTKRRGVTKRGNALDAIKPPGWVGPEQAIARAIAKAIDPDDDVGHSGTASPPGDVP